MQASCAKAPFPLLGQFIPSMLPPPAVQENVYFNSKDETGKRFGDIHKLSTDHFFGDNKKIYYLENDSY